MFMNQVKAQVQVGQAEPFYKNGSLGVFMHQVKVQVQVGQAETSTMPARLVIRARN